MVQEYIEHMEEYTKNQAPKDRGHRNRRHAKTKKNSGQKDGQKSVGRHLFLPPVVLAIGGVGFAHLECGTGYRNAKIMQL